MNGHDEFEGQLILLLSDVICFELSMSVFASQIIIKRSLILLGYSFEVRMKIYDMWKYVYAFVNFESPIIMCS